jgi:hypothetical protein
MHCNSASDCWWHAAGMHVLVAVALGALCLAAATVRAVPRLWFLVSNVILFIHCMLSALALLARLLRCVLS